MEHSAREAYLEAQILTATPQKLRLMLIEGAIQFARQTLRHWEADRLEQGFESLVRCRKIVTELLSSIRLDDSDMTYKMSQVYLFIFRTLTEAQSYRDARKMEEVLRVLDEERVTWQEICRRVPEVPPEVYEQRPQEITTPGISPSNGDAGSGLSLDA